MTLAYTVRPISDRSPFRGEYAQSQFTADWSDTLTLLERELRHLDAERVVLEVDVAERGIRVDGQLRADARPSSPAVRLAFDSRHGPLQYATDRFVRPSWRSRGAPHWQHNVRAIALGLEALRQVDRYGVSSGGEQYTGWRALPAGSGDAIAMPGASAMTVEQAARVVVDLAEGLPGDVGTVIEQPEVRRLLYRRAAARVHPDRGGDPVVFARLQDARRLLDEHAPR